MSFNQRWFLHTTESSNLFISLLVCLVYDYVMLLIVHTMQSVWYYGFHYVFVVVFSGLFKTIFLGKGESQ